MQKDKEQQIKDYVAEVKEISGISICNFFVSQTAVILLSFVASHSCTESRK